MFLPPGPDLAWRGNYISLPAATLKAPVEGNRTIPVEITWLRDGAAPSYAVVFNAREQRVTPITQIAAVHVSNIHSSVPVRLLFPDTGFEIELGANLEGYYPVVTNGLEFIAYSPTQPSGQDGVTIQVLNFLPPPLIFGLSPGGTVAGVSNITTAAPLTGGPITSTGQISLATPLAIQYGGTGQTTPDRALDALSETSGSQVGLLARDASGNWVLQPLSAGGSPALPVSILNGGSGATTGFLALDNFTAAGSQTGVLQRNAGGAWSLSAAGAGTITGVTAGPGLSGGGGTGVVALALSTPVALANGGTAATSRNGAMDSLTQASGPDTGVLTRSAGGNWGLDAGALDVGMGGTGTVSNTLDAILAGGGVAAIKSTAASVNNAGTLSLTQTGGAALVINTPTATDAHIELKNGTTGFWTVGGQGYANPGEFWIHDTKNTRLPFLINTAGVVGMQLVQMGSVLPGDAITGSILAHNISLTGNTGISNNTYQTQGVGQKYLNNGLASVINLSNGEFNVYTIPTGTAGTTISVFDRRLYVNSTGQTFLDSTGLPTLSTSSPTGGILAQFNAGVGAGSPADGHIRVGNNRYTWKFGVQGFASPDQFWIYNETRGALGIIMDSVTGACFNQSGSWSAFSDGSLKEQVSPYLRGLDAVMALNPVTFRYKAGTPAATENEPSEFRFGLLAEDVQPHIPEIVGHTVAPVRGVDEQLLTLTPGDLTYVLINAIKQLKAELDALKAGQPAPEAAAVTLPPETILGTGDDRPDLSLRPEPNVRRQSEVEPEHPPRRGPGRPPHGRH